MKTLSKIIKISSIAVIFLWVLVLIVSLSRNLIIYFSPEQCHERLPITFRLEELKASFLAFMLFFFLTSFLYTINLVFTKLKVYDLMNKVTDKLFSYIHIPSEVVAFIGITSALTLLIMGITSLIIAGKNLYNFYYCL